MASVDSEGIFGDRYRLLWRSDRPPRVAYVRNYAENQRGFRSTPVVLDDGLIKEWRMRFLAYSGRRPQDTIFVSNEFMDLAVGLREAAIWHEVGHVHFDHARRYDFSSQEGIQSARVDAIQNGRIVEWEAEADSFAVARVGPEAFIAFLTHVLGTRPTGAPTGLNELGRRELELRIEATRLYPAPSGQSRNR